MCTYIPTYLLVPITCINVYLSVYIFFIVKKMLWIKILSDVVWLFRYHTIYQLIVCTRAQQL